MPIRSDSQPHINTQYTQRQIFTQTSVLKLHQCKLVNEEIREILFTLQIRAELYMLCYNTLTDSSSVTAHVANKQHVYLCTQHSTSSDRAVTDVLPGYWSEA